MSTIEERLARDIAAVTGGVVVTESDLQEAREVLEVNMHTDRRRRRRGAALAIAAAVTIPVMAVALARTLGSDQSAPPAGQVTPGQAAPKADNDPGLWLTGRTPTTSLVQGVWRQDNGGVQMRFAAGGAFASDQQGRLFQDPALAGTWRLSGDQVTITLTGGSSGCADARLHLRVSLVHQGELHVVPTEPGTSRCSLLPATWETLEQVLPTKPSMAGFRNSDQESWTRWTRPGQLDGLWMAEGGGHAMEIGADGTYVVADRHGDPVDRGQWEFRRDALTLTSSAGSTTCAPGDRLVWSGVDQLRPGTYALRGTVRDNTCGVPWAATHWIMIPDSRTR